MTRDEFIEMWSVRIDEQSTDAREAEAQFARDVDVLLAAERERCAQIYDEVAKGALFASNSFAVAVGCAREIRKLNEPPKPVKRCEAEGCDNKIDGAFVTNDGEHHYCSFDCAEGED